MNGELLCADGRAVVVAIDHSLYSWPCSGLEDRTALIEQVVRSGADGIIASYGTIRQARGVFEPAEPILKLDLSTVSLGDAAAEAEFVVAWTLEDAVRLGVKCVLTYVPLGHPSELQALRAAARVASDANDADLTYICEIEPIKSERFPDPRAPQAIAAAARTGAELGARIIKTAIPSPPDGIAQASVSDVPVLLAGGEVADDIGVLLDAVRLAIGAGAAGVAFGRNVWTREDPAAIVSALAEIVHPQGDCGRGHRPEKSQRETE